MISIIVAASRNGIIGANGDLPWRDQLPADMRHFMDLTMGHAVIMGRLTYKSIPKDKRPLSGRTNIVLSRDPNFSAPCRVVPSLTAALRTACQVAAGEVFVIGGSSVYAEAMPLAHRIYLTLIDAAFEGDSRFPEIDFGQWAMRESVSHFAAGRNRYGYTFVTYDRRGDQ